MELKFAFSGFGNVARTFARMITVRETDFASSFDVRWRVTGIATGRHGCITSSEGIDVVKAAACVEGGGNLADLPGTIAAPDPLTLIYSCDADILFETTPLNIEDGEPAITHIRSALTRGMHVVTANKGPIAFAYADLISLAREHGVSFHFEGTVMDGTPVFNLVERCLPGVRILGFSGVLNSTTNLILTGMERGRSFEDGLEEARRRGIAEANADYDIDGWDAAVKAVALANVLMHADTRPALVARKGIAKIKTEDLESAAQTGMAVRLISRGRLAADEVRLTVAPERVPITSALGTVLGTSNVLVLETDLMGEIAIVENEPGIEQTAYALLSDLMRIHSDI